MDDITSAIKKAAEGPVSLFDRPGVWRHVPSGPMKGILGFTDHEVVSTDFVTCPYSSIFVPASDEANQISEGD